MELTNLSYRSKYKKEEFEKLEKETIQLKETFILLNEIVKEQEVHIDTISDFIENSKQNIITGNNEITKANEYNKSNIIQNSIFAGIGIIGISFPLSYLFGLGYVLPITASSLTGLTLYTKIVTN